MEKKFISHRAATKYASGQPFGSCYTKGNKVITKDCGGKVSAPSAYGKGYKDCISLVQQYKKPATRK